MIDPLVGAANVFEGAEADLGNNCTKLATGCGNAVAGGAIAGREHLARDNEGGRVGAKVEEKLGQREKNKEEDGRVVEDGIVTEAEDEEDDGQNGETTELDGLATNLLNGEHGDPIARNGAQQIDDDVTDDSVVEVGVSVSTTSELNGLEDEGVVEAETVPCDVECKPRVRSTEEDLAVLPLAKVIPEIGPRCRGNLRL